MKKRLSTSVLWLSLVCVAFGVYGESAKDGVDSPRLNGDYVAVVSNETADDAAWKSVVQALEEKYDAKVVRYSNADVGGALAELQKLRPRYVCFVAQAGEATGAFVQTVHRLTRAIDEDPYTDCIWAILTGYDAEDALRIVREKPFQVRRVLAATPLVLDCAEAGVWFSEGTKNEKWVKEPGEEPQRVQGPDDPTEELVGLFNSGKCDLFITSGHASQRDWNIGYAYPAGRFVSQSGGKLAGLTLDRRTLPIESSAPCIHLAVGNCLIGNINSTDNCMALGLIHSAGVRQMVGYVVPTWFGYMGWGLNDYFYLQPGRYTVAEAFFANGQALIHRLETAVPGINRTINEAKGERLSLTLSPAAQELGVKPGDIRGLLFDRDVVAIYGDPAWNARMLDGQNEWEQNLSVADGEAGEKVFTITLVRKPFDNTDNNGSQRGNRPFIIFLPDRLTQAEDGSVPTTILEGEAFKPMIADDFVLIPRFNLEMGKEYKIRFSAKVR
ncbi:MAG: hypothetical protein Q4D38_07080 [Planctomycetia bacterium]|nr:hypothetical protein [Planctomycetia bacterium]